MSHTQMIGAEMRTCEVEGCFRKHKARGFCSKHLQTLERRNRGVLPRHLAIVRKSCRLCGKPAHAHELCDNHYGLEKRNGDPNVMRRKKNGEGHLCKTHGYRFVFVDGKQRSEHRVVAEKMLGRPLLRNEVVHHKDGNKLNNDPNNLEVMTQSEHAKIHYQQGGNLKPQNTIENKIHNAVLLLKRHAPHLLKEGC